jgi:hypothetical protein
MKTARQVLFLPGLLAGLSLIGLISALVSDGWGDVLAWLLLAIPALWPLHSWYRVRRKN